ncbi:uncharacterized protein LOC124165125 isoform X3 [Ischnura elegans]|uniref:uncharacterized protein LOC124165125 isoform X3 n=1 Tax=Ischnura elegans TaxID=197161 RepID=UPI001ED8A75C|nr:uncharacterized protein LOC124165125 isoform X3 [Ischnura elegans]
MGIEQMRGNYGRYPPFLFGGLLLVCLISTVQWWSLATQNNDLIRQLEDLGEKFKLSSDQREQCLQLRMVLDNRLKNTEDELAQVKVRLEKMKVEVNNMKTQESQKDVELKTQMKNAGDAQNAAAMCGSELESLKKLDIAKDGTIASLKIEKDKYSSKVDEKDQEISKLKSELDAVKVKLSSLKEEKLTPKALASSVNNAGEQGAEQDDNHGGERDDGEEVPVLPEKKSLSLPRKAPTKSSVNNNETMVNERNKEAEAKEEENFRKEENSQVKPPEQPPI